MASLVSTGHSGRLGNLATPRSVQKLQRALHAKAKAEAGYRSYALDDKISRNDILTHAYVQCRANKGAPGVDDQDFAQVEAYGVNRSWLDPMIFPLRQNQDRFQTSIFGGGWPKLSGYYLGYSITYAGALVGLVWAFVHGFITGVLIVWLYDVFCKVFYKSDQV